MKNQTVKFQPEHFPVGTFFEVEEQYAMSRYKEVAGQAAGSTDKRYEEDFSRPKLTIFAVQEIMQISPAQYVLVTTTPGEGFIKRNASYNLQCVKRIVRRGDGAVKINRMPGFNADVWYRKEVTMLQSGWRFCYPGVVGSPKTHYISLGGTILIRLLHHKFGPHTQCVLDAQRMAHALRHESFYHTVVLGRTHVYYAPKKRVDAWYRANVNRFLLSVRHQEQEHRRRQYDDYEKYMEADLREELRSESMEPGAATIDHGAFDKVDRPACARKSSFEENPMTQEEMDSYYLGD